MIRLFAELSGHYPRVRAGFIHVPGRGLPLAAMENGIRLAVETALKVCRA